MFLDFYNLRSQPFGVTPDPRYLYESPGHREALACLCYAVENNLGFAVLTARPGTGKTTLLFEMLKQYGKKCLTAFLVHTQCSSVALLRMLLQDFGVDTSEHDPLLLVEQLKRILITESQSGMRPLIVIDEAQNLDSGTLETVRLLSNLETPDSKLLNIILSGQLQFAHKLLQPDLEQLRQRIALVAQLAPLSLSETTNYISHRLQVAGFSGGHSLFTTGAVAMIAERSGGVPREINRLCFQSLSLACALRKLQVDDEVLREVKRDLQIITVPEENENELHSLKRPKGRVSGQSIAANDPPASRARPDFSGGTDLGPSARMPASRTQTGGRVHRTGRQAFQFAAARAKEAVGRRAALIKVGRGCDLSSVNSTATATMSQHSRPPHSIPLAAGSELNYRGFLICAALLIITAAAAITAAIAPSLLQPGSTSDETVSNSPSKTSANTPHSGGSSLASAGSGEKKMAQSAATAVSPIHLKAHKERLSDNEEMPSHGAPPWIVTTQGPNSSGVPKRVLEDESDIAVPNVRSFATADPPPEMKTILGTTKSYALAPAVAPNVEAVVPARVIKQIPPVYPAAAKAARIRGVVVLDATIDIDGNLRSIHVISGSPMFVRAAIDAVMGWKFSPSMVHGHPVEVPTRLRFEFSI